MNPPCPQLRSVGGYSLIELVVIIVLIGIMVSLAGPSLQGTVQSHRAQRALDQVLADVAFTRVLAVREGVQTELAFGTTTSYSVRRIPPTGSPVLVRTVELGREYPGVAADLQTGLSRLRFSSRGLLRNLSTDGFIKVHNATLRDSAFVSPAGRVYRVR